MYGHVTAMSSSPDLTQSHSSDFSPKNAASNNAHAAAASKMAVKTDGVGGAVGIGVGGGASMAGSDVSGRADRQSTLGRRGSVELTKSEEDLFKEGIYEYTGTCSCW